MILLLLLYWYSGNHVMYVDVQEYAAAVFTLPDYTAVPVYYCCCCCVSWTVHMLHVQYPFTYIDRLQT